MSNKLTEKHLEMGTATVSSTAKAISHADFGFNADNLAAADTAYIFAATNPLRMMTTGDDPTATVGIPVTTSGAVVVSGNANINNIKLIRESADGVATIILAVTV